MSPALQLEHLTALAALRLSNTRYELDSMQLLKRLRSLKLLGLNAATYPGCLSRLTQLEGLDVFVGSLDDHDLLVAALDSLNQVTLLCIYTGIPKFRPAWQCCRSSGSGCGNVNGMLLPAYPTDPGWRPCAGWAWRGAYWNDTLACCGRRHSWSICARWTCQQ